MPVLQLDNEARQVLQNYRWPGNIRQLKNITEQISIIEQNKNISAQILKHYLPQIVERRLPVLYKPQANKSEFSERDLLYKILFDMKRDITDLKKLVFDLMENQGTSGKLSEAHSQIIQQLKEESTENVNLKE